MRNNAYWLFALVAWPAAAWGVIELALRAATGTAEGMLDTAAVTACAFTTIAAARMRRRALAETSAGR